MEIVLIAVQGPPDGTGFIFHDIAGRTVNRDLNTSYLLRVLVVASNTTAASSHHPARRKVSQQ